MRVEFKKYLAFVICVFYLHITNAQLRGINAVFARPNYIMNFSGDTPTFHAIGVIAGINNVNLISNDQGQVDVFSDGNTCWNRYNDTVFGAENLFPIDAAIRYYADGNAFMQGHILIDKPETERRYYVLGVGKDNWHSYPFNVCNILEYALIDMNQNNDSGAVVFSNRVLYRDSLASGRLKAVKHANGRDWWVVVPRYNSNIYFKFLVQSDTVLGPFTQAIGPKMEGVNDVGAAGFSRDGSLYATGIDALQVTKPPLVIMNFDRCTGEFYNVRTVDGNDSISTTRCYGAVFSPNNRFLYTGSRDQVWQYDLSQSNLKATRYKVVERGVLPLGFCHGTYSSMFLAPNNVIYIGSLSGGREYSTIQFPDSTGFSCSYQPCSYGSPDGRSWGISVLPNETNYDLGPVTIEGVSAGADTLVCAGDTVRIGSTARAEVLYEWLPQAGLLQNYAAEVEVSPLQSTSYILHATDTVAAYSCFEKYDTVTVGIIAPGTMGCPTGIKEQQAFKLRVYPNPAKEVLVIETAENGKYTLHLKSISGQKLLSEEVVIQNSYRLALQGIAAGSYVLEVQNASGAKVQSKVVVY